MREKLLDLMKNEGLKPSQLAELLEINPAGISHILAGRNKPGFDLLQKILRRFPRISPDWLILDTGKMYRDDESLPSPVDNGLFGETADMQRSEPPETIAPMTPHQPEQIIPSNTLKTNSAAARIVIFYDDDTFQSFTPGKR